MIIGKKIKEYRVKHKLTQTQLAAQLGVRDNTIALIERGERGVGKNLLLKISQMLNISMEELLTGIPSSAKSLEISDFKKIPLFASEIPAGFPKQISNDEIDEWIYCLSDIKADFAIKVKGDSMIGRNIHDEDILYCKKQNHATNGDIVIARTDSEDEFTIKTYKKSGSQIILMPENNKYPPIIPKNINVIGKVVAIVNRVL